MTKMIVTGASGFIGGHLVKRLMEDGFYVRGVDIVPPPKSYNIKMTEFQIRDLTDMSECVHAVKGIDWVFNLAADMGGIGYIGTVQAMIARHNVLINTNMLEAARRLRVERFFFSSSACVYPSFKQDYYSENLKEEDAIPADPEPGYGWEKLFTEQMCKYYREDYSLDTHVARFHNVFGPYGTYDGGREKAPAAICRKVAVASNGDEIEVWGDGEQTRTFLYIDDCVEGIVRLMQSNFQGPVNIGSDRKVTINELVDMVCDIAKKRLRKRHVLNMPEGVHGRSSDNTLIREKLGWAPNISLEAGLGKTYRWIEGMVRMNVY